MALIDCPECGGQGSDRAPTCPHCGVPIADNTAPASALTEPAPSNTRADATAQAYAPAGTPASATAVATGPSETSTETVEPFKLRLAGRPIPIASILFWGGMVLGMGFKYLLPPAADSEPEMWRRLPWAMIWAGVLWFAVTEFGALVRNKLRKR